MPENVNIEINISADGDKLIIRLFNRLDTSNAPIVEKKIIDAINENSSEEVVFDIENLEYISSAGLRIFIKVYKLTGKKILILNASRDVYDIFETTGFAEMFEIKKAYRSISVDGCEVIGKGFYGTVYRLDKETIVKVYKGHECIPLIENEKRIAQKAFIAGIPTAISYDIVRVGDDYGSVFELLDSETFHDIILSRQQSPEEVVAKYIELVKQIHRTHMNRGELPSCKERFLDYLEFIKEIISEDQYTSLKRLLSEMEDETTVVHGDIHMKNVMSTGGEAMLIDMDTMGLGNPVFDLAGLYVTYQEFEEDEPENSMNFLSMTQDQVDNIWRLITEYYFTNMTEAEVDVNINKIRLVAAIRFLFLIQNTDLKNGELGKIRIEHTRKHMDELLLSVDSLAIVR